MARITFHPAVAPLKSLDPANDTVEAGRYLATTLSAVDGDLVAGNIADGITIFGVLGTLVATPTITELFFEEGLQAGGGAWVLKKTIEVPAAALKIVTAMATGDPVGSDCGAKILYNGVEKVKVDWGAAPDFGALARWGGDGLGSAQDMTYYIRSSGGANNYWRATLWYVT